MNVTLPLCVSLFAAVPLHAAQDGAQDAGPTTLVLDRPIEGDLVTGDADQYVIESEADQFVFGDAFQETVDVVVRIFGPDEEQLAEFDGPAFGPEPFTFETKAAGRYRIEVTPFEDGEGDYSISLRMHEPVATDGPSTVDQLMAPFSGPHIPGGVVGVVHKGEVIFQKAYGMANLVHGVPFTVETPSNLGSTSKQFTAFAIALLDQRGELSLDDDVRKHIPEVPDLDETVTLRNLITHTSGYREFLNLLVLAGRRIDEGDFIDRSELIAVLQRQPALQNSPGAEFNYNNTGYGLLTVVVERVTGGTFPDWMQANVFGPLGMTHTFVRAHPSQLIPGSSQGYMPAQGGFRDSRDLGGAMGAGGIYSTPSDMAKWIRNLQTGEALGGLELMQVMATPNKLTNGESSGYGFGLFIDEQNGQPRVHHGGSDSAHRSMMMTYPGLEAGIVTLSNHAGFNSTATASKIAAAFFPEHLQAAGDAAAVAEASAPEADESAFDPDTFDPADFDAFVGRYELEAMPGFILAFTREGDQFFTQATGQPKLEIEPVSPSKFELLDVEAAVTFHRDETGAVTEATLHQNGDHAAKRLEEEIWAPTAEELGAYAGRYFCAEIETFYTFIVEDGALVLKHRRMDDARLTPTEEHTFQGGSTQLVFVSSDDGTITGFTADSGRTRGVAFERVD